MEALISTGLLILTNQNIVDLNGRNAEGDNKRYGCKHRYETDNSGCGFRWAYWICACGYNIYFIYYFRERRAINIFEVLTI